MPRPEDRQPLGESIGDIVDRMTTIVHEEIELAKAEISIALQDLMRGSVAGIVGGVFAFFGLFILLIALSFLIADAIGLWYPWLGFFIVAFICFAIGGALAFLALKKIKKGSQLAPTQAIDEAKQTRSALQSEADKTIETIDAVAVEEASPSATAEHETVVTAEVVSPPEPTTATEPIVTPATPAGAKSAATIAGEELEVAREAADELELDAKAAKRRAKQEAKEAKQAAKEARRAENEAAKAEAIAAKQAAKAAKAQEKERTKAAKAAAKAGQPDRADDVVTGEHQAPPVPSVGEDYVAPKPPPGPNDPNSGG
jgi:type IV secretory pathway VirB10-like protein